MSNITIIMGYHHRTKQGTPQRTLTSFKGRGLRSVGIIVDNNFAVRHWLWSGGGCDPLFSARSSSRPVSAQLSMRTPSGRHSLLRAKERQAMGGMGPSCYGHRAHREEGREGGREGEYPRSLVSSSYPPILPYLGF